MVFKRGKWEVVALKQEVQNRTLVATSANVWIDTDLTQVWVNSFVGAFALNRRLLAWDSHKCHMEDKMQYKSVGCVIVPGGCTMYIQAPDVGWN